MKVKLYDNCKLYCLNRETKKVSIIDPLKVDVTIKNGFPDYKLIDKSFNCIIVQASNPKKASAKILYILMKKK